MSEDAEGLDELTRRIGRAAADKEGFGKVIQLDLGDAGVIRIDGSGPLTSVDNVAGEADATVSLSAKTLSRLMSGKTSAPVAVATGKIKVKGDAALVLKLARFL